MNQKPLTTIQAEARAAFDEKFPGVHTNVSWGMEECDCDPDDPKEKGTCLKKIQAFLDTQLSLAHAAGKAEGEVKGRNDAVDYVLKECKGHNILDHNRVEQDPKTKVWVNTPVKSFLEAARLPHTEEKN